MGSGAVVVGGGVVGLSEAVGLTVGDGMGGDGMGGLGGAVVGLPAVPDLMPVGSGPRLMSCPEVSR